MVIPVHNGADHLETLLEDLIPPLEDLGRSWEIFFVDDHSSDGSFDRLRDFRGGDPRIGGCRLAERRGQQNALLCGLLSCRGEVILTMDDDGQHPASRIPGMLRTLEEGWDVVYLVNRDRRRRAVLRFGTFLTDLFFRIFCGKPAGVEIGSFRVLRRQVLERFREASGHFVYISALIFRSRPRPAVCSLRYTAQESRGGSRGSRFSFRRRLGVFLRLFLYYGPFRRLLPRRGVPYRVEARL